MRMRNFINNIFMLVLVTITLTISACSAPKPTKISFTNARTMKPVNFNEDITDNNIVIKSSRTRAQTKVQNCQSKQFVYSIDEYQERSPEFFYTLAHADKIIAHIKPPFIDYVFYKVQYQLRDYGITTRPELFIEEDDNQNPQVILECIKFKPKRNSFFNLKSE